MALVQVRMSTQQTAQRLTSIQYGLSNCRESKGTIPPFLYCHKSPQVSIQCSLFMKPDGWFNNNLDPVFIHLTVHIGPQLFDSLVHVEIGCVE